MTNNQLCTNYKTLRDSINQYFKDEKEKEGNNESKL
jgi:hypothetical protein